MKKGKIILLTIFFLSGVVRSELKFHFYELTLSQNIRRYEVMDLNKDGLQEIVVFPEIETDNSTLYILWQSQEGFSPENIQTISMDSRAILCDFGDVVGDEKLELIFLTSSGVSFYEQNSRRFNSVARDLLKINSIFRLKPEKELPYWNFVTEITPEGKEEIILPQFYRTIVFSFIDSSWQRIADLKLPAKATINSFSSMNISYRLKQIYVADCNQDGLYDILARENDKFYLFLQNEQHRFADHASSIFDMKFRPDKPKYNEETNITAIKDINGDGILDLIANKTAARENILNPQSQIQIYLGKKNSEQLWSLTPNQIIMSKGVQFDEQIVDLNGDGKLDFSIPSVELGLMRIIKILLTKSVKVDVRIFQMRDDDTYPTQPDAIKNFTIKFNFNIGANSAGGEGIVPVFNVDGDFNGDGLNDLLTTSDQRHLSFHFGKKGQIFSNTADENFTVQIPKNGNRVEVYDLNENGKSDIILNYQRQDDNSEKLTKLIRILLQ